MLSKETLLKCDSQSPVYLTVGVSHSMRPISYNTIVGYNEGSMGSVDKIPHWNGARLASLSDFYLTGSIQSTILSLGNYSDKTIPSAIEVTRLDTGYSVKFEYYNSGMFDGNYGEFFSESDNGNTIPLIFTPPPYRISIRKSSGHLPAIKRRVR